MSSKEEILADIRKNTKRRYDYPVYSIHTTVYPDKTTKFLEVSDLVGGEAILLEERQDINDVICEKYPTAKSIVSNMDEITCATLNPDVLENAVELNGIEVAVVKGELGVAENGAVWISQSVKHKALYFIAEKLVIVLDRNRIVNNMHEAYEQLKNEQYKFGVFISGPSKTADIEQALVMGAHGARDVLVILT
ncbi:LutC/YkgG family protein [Bacteroides heparinolyticus]|uniref:LutC/YkgG family protein n=1 Tax=Prevotella heparinolytica TaxID=28113 RepID=UPI0023F167FF|nr:LUD domain-containing protein [Bacteroides heparinolyticus]